MIAYHTMDLLGRSLLLLLFVNGTLGFEVQGNMTMTNVTETIERAEIGDLVGFSFDLSLELESDDNDVLFVFSGDSFKFPEIPSYRSVSWNMSLINETQTNHNLVANDNIINTTFSNLVIAECVDIDTNDTVGVNSTGNATMGYCYNDTDNIDERMAFMDDDRTSLVLNLTLGLPRGNWSFTGILDMELDESLVEGSLVRGILAIWVIENGTHVSTKYVITDVVTIPPPEIVIATPSSLVQPILGLFTTQVVFNTTRDSLTAIIGCLTPYENGTNEVMLTLQSMKVLPYDTTGIHENTTEYLEDFGHGVMTSTIGSYQMNEAVLRLNKIPRFTPLYDRMVVKSSFVVRVEDYSKLADGDRCEVKINIRFQEYIIWVGNIIISLDAPEVRKPSLKVTVTQTKQCPYDGSTTATMVVLVAHDSSSTATAYNVTLNIYLPPYINMKSKTFSTPKENRITVEQDGAVINAEIARLTFSDPFTLTTDLDLDLSSNYTTLYARNRIVTAEALYNDRWGNQTDLLTDTAYTSLSIRSFCAKRIRWGTSGNCLPGACSCENTGYSPTKCVPCGEMWRCKALVHVPHFESISRIQGIICEASMKRRSGPTFSSCYKQLWNPTRYMEISPRVSIITGRDSDSGHYFAISNNGAIYMVSKDGAVTWEGVTDNVYNMATAEPTFQWASFI